MLSIHVMAIFVKWQAARADASQPLWQHKCPGNALAAFFGGVDVGRLRVGYLSNLLM